MQIIAGIARGRRILAPPGYETRPTLARVKKSLFDILQYRMPQSIVLDLFAGSGSLGLEAVSRGAKKVVFNDKARASCDVIRKNIQTLGFEKSTQVLQMDFERAIEYLTQHAEQFDIVFLDPPYAEGGQKAAEMLCEHHIIAQNGMIACEHAWNHPIISVPGLLRRVDLRKYGDIGISLLESEN